MNECTLFVLQGPRRRFIFFSRIHLHNVALILWRVYDVNAGKKGISSHSNGDIVLMLSFKRYYMWTSCFFLSYFSCRFQNDVVVVQEMHPNKYWMAARRWVWEVFGLFSIDKWYFLSLCCSRFIHRLQLYVYALCIIFLCQHCVHQKRHFELMHFPTMIDSYSNNKAFCKPLLVLTLIKTKKQKLIPTSIICIALLFQRFKA